MNENSSVPYIIFESVIARDERIIKRLYIVLVVIIIAWLLTIGAGLWYISLPVEEYTNQEVDDIDNSHITQKVGD